MRTLATLVQERARLSPDGVAVRSRVHDEWRDQTWTALAQRVDAIAAGLLSAPGGLQPGERVGILANTSGDWIALDHAALSVGAVTVPIYTSLPAPEVGYVHADAALRIVVVGDAAQYATIQAVRQGFEFLDRTYPASELVLRHVVVVDPAGLHPSEEWESLADLEDRGRSVLSSVRPELERRRQAVSPDAVATFTYTSGTTGAPKAVIQTSRNHLAVVEGTEEVGLLDGAMRSSGLFLFLPLAHSFGRLIEFASVVHDLPVVVSSVPTLARDLHESRPGFLPAAPRVYEKLEAGVERQIAGSSAVRRALAGRALRTGERAARTRLEGHGLTRTTEVQLAVADRLVLGRIRSALGLDRTVAMLSGAAPLQPAVHLFFEALGLPLYEAYGLTETCPGLTTNRPGQVRIGTVGRALPGVELRIAGDGEVLARGANITQGYHGRESDTAAAIDPDGWFHTGDEGRLDDDGYLTITGRKKDLIKTSGGKYVVPAKIEGALKLHPLVQEAVVVGDGRQYCTALVAVDVEELADRATRTGAPASPSSPEVTAEIDAHVAAVNAGLASFETIKYWSAIEAPTVESGLMTASLKIKRRQVEKQWSDVVDSMYATS